MKIVVFIEKLIIDSNNNPLNGVKEKLNEWLLRGAEIEFITGINKFLELKKLNETIKDLGFANPKIHSKKDDEKFMEIIKEVQPNLLIEKIGNSDEAKPLKEKIIKEKTKVLLLEEDADLTLLSDDPEELLVIASESPVEDLKDSTY